MAALLLLSTQFQSCRQIDRHFKEPYRKIAAIEQRMKPLCDSISKLENAKAGHWAQIDTLLAERRKDSLLLASGKATAQDSFDIEFKAFLYYQPLAHMHIQRALATDEQIDSVNVARMQQEKRGYEKHVEKATLVLGAILLAIAIPLTIVLSDWQHRRKVKREEEEHRKK